MKNNMRVCLWADGKDPVEGEKTNDTQGRKKNADGDLPAGERYKTGGQE